MRVVLKRTVVGDWRFDNLSGSHLQSQVNSFCHYKKNLQAVAWNSHGVACFCCCRRNCDATRDATRALATCRQTITLWLRYVDGTFTTVHKDETDDFHDHLNEQNADIQLILFTTEIEENGKVPFLDCLVQQRNNNELRTTTDAYRQITWRTILQPDFTQSHDYKDFDETSATSL